MPAVRDQLQLWLRAVAPPASDAALVRRFTASKDQQAFADLVERHRRWVLGVCRRIAASDADDVFQAVFLTLARHAHRLRAAESLPAWLHAVASRLALNAARTRQRRSAAELRARPRDARDPLDEVSARELLSALDAAVARLPDSERAALILCSLDGLSLDEAAARLGVTPGAVKGRLERGRARLRRDLARFGVPMCAGLFMAPAPVVAQPLIDATIAIGIGSAAPSAAVEAIASASSRRLISIIELLAAVTIGAGLLTFDKPDAPAQPLPKPVAPKLDRHGDPLPDGAIARFGTERLRASDSQLALSTDGKTIITVSRSMVVREWDAVDGRLKGVRRLSNYSAWACALSPDGKYFLTNGNWGPDADKLVVWNVGTGERAFSRQFPAPAGVKAAAYLPDGSGVIVLVETQKHSAVGRADFATGNWQELFAVPIANGEHLELSPDGRKVAVRAGQGFLFCWDLDTNNALWRLTGMGTAFTFSPDSKTIVVDNSPAKTLEFHDAATGEKIADAKLPAQHRSWGEWSGTVNFSLRFTPDSRGLLFYDHDKRAMIVWDLVSGKERLRLAAGFIVNRRSAFAPDGSLVTLARTLQRWDLKTGKPAFSDNERAGHTKAPSRFEFSADGRRLLSVSTDHTARVWDVATTTPLATFRGHDSDQVSAGRFLHGGREVITAGNDGYLRVWDAVTSQEERSMPYREKEDVESAYAQHLCLAADGRTVTSFNSTGRGVRLMRYDATTGEKLTSTLVSGWTPSPDGRLAFPRANTSARLIDTETNGTFGVIEYGTPAGVCDSLDEHVTSFSADARLFAGLLRRSPGGNSAEWIVQVWETTGGPPIESIATTAFFYVPHAFSRDGRLFAFGEPDALRVWDLAAGREIWRREDATRNVTALAFTPDGRALAAASDDTTILLWALPAPAKGKPIAAAERDAVWQSLGSSDVATAHAAQWRLTDDRDTAVALIRAKLLPAPAAAEAVRSHIQNLSSADFKTREAAERRLKDLGRAAAKELRAAHAAESQPEAKRRVEALLAALDAETARDVRAVAILERIATPAARKLLDDISHTSPPRAAANAKLALQRLAD